LLLLLDEDLVVFSRAHRSKTFFNGKLNLLPTSLGQYVASSVGPVTERFMGQIPEPTRLKICHCALEQVLDKGDPDSLWVSQRELGYAKNTFPIHTCKRNNPKSIKGKL
jgi:hypothetical protein